MQALMLSEIAGSLNIVFEGPDQPILGIALDAREVQPSQLFVAVQGARFDGHDFIPQAIAQGACAVLVNRQQDYGVTQLIVEDTVKALGSLAAYYRSQFLIPLVGITGSSGKTTVKEMVSSILRQVGSVLNNKGNFNNEIGVPLTLLQLEPHHRYAVVEMGARREHDIGYLGQLTQPSVALVTNIGTAHLEIFGSRETIARAKSEIYASLAPNGIAILNQDEPYSVQWARRLRKHKIITYSLEHMSDITSAHLVSAPTETQFELITDIGSAPIRLKAPGLHNVQNALAAAAAARALGINLSDIQQGLNQFRNVSGRLEVRVGLRECEVIDDTYNANLESMRAAIEVLAKASHSVRTVFVMADMMELGRDTKDYHKQIGLLAKQRGIDHFLGIGPLTHEAVLGFGGGARHYQEKNCLIADLQTLAQKNMTILVKGSRSMAMEEVVSAICLPD